MTIPAFIYTDDYIHYNFSETHPLQQIRLMMTERLLSAYSHFEGGDAELVAPIPASMDQLRKVHSHAYLDALRALSDGHPMPGAARFGFGSSDNPPFHGMWEATQLYVGASIIAAQRVLSGQNTHAFNTSGGLHHAMRERAAGFCIANDCASAAHVFLEAGKSVAYIDIDAHHGDGVQTLFYTDPRVLTISLHETPETLFPHVTGFTREIGDGDGLGYNANLPLWPYSTDEHYEFAFDSVVTPLIGAFAPDYIVLQVGADSHYGDPLTHLALSSHGWLSMVKKVIGFGKPIVALGGGGYNLKAVARLWTLCQGCLAGVDLPNDVPDAFAREWDITTLHDPVKPAISQSHVEDAWPQAKEAVDDIRRMVFGLHGL